MIVTYRPLDTWPDPNGLTPADARQGSRFEATWAATLVLLGREIDALGDDGCVIELAVERRDFTVGGAVRANARPRHPGVIVSFDSERHGPLRYFTDRFTDSEYGNGSRFLVGWQANVRAVAKSLEALRLVERYGTANRGEQYTGWAQLGAGTPLGPPAPMTRDEAARTLLVGADMSTTPALVAEALDDAAFVGMLYRIAARQHHPDAGGSADTFRKITEARDLLVSDTKGSTAC